MLSVKIAPPAPVVKILFALKDIHPISPIVPECLILFLYFIKLPKLSEASSIILIFLFLHKLTISFRSTTLPNTCTMIIALTFLF